jgi:hypothetical protein
MCQQPHYDRVDSEGYPRRRILQVQIFVDIAFALPRPHFSRSFHVLSFLFISCYVSSAYSTSINILDQAELSSDGHDEEKGDGDVEPLHAAVRFSFRSSVESDIYLTIS